MSAAVIDFRTRTVYTAPEYTDMERDIAAFASRMVALYGAAVAVVVAPPGREAVGYRVGCLARLLEELPVFYNGLLDASADGA